MFDRKILIFMTSFNWKKFAHLNISPQTNGKMKNRVRQWNGVGGVEGKGKQDRIKDRMEVQESDKE